MRRVLSTFAILSLILVPIAASALDGFPVFPMAFWGNVTINGSAAPVDSVVRAYYGSTLAGTVTAQEAGVYGYTEPTKQKLIVAEGTGVITFRIQASGFNGGSETGGTNPVTYSSFTSGSTIQKDLAFSIDNVTLSLVTSSNSDGSFSATVPSATEASTTSSGIITTLDISAGNVITGPSGWNGKLTLPTATTNFTLTANSGNTASAVQAIEVGAGDTPLTFSQAVKLTFAGQAGKLIGWSQAGTFHQITATCDSAASPTLAFGADCKIAVSSDLVVWTKHLSTFIAYTETAIPTPAPSPVSSGGGGGGGGNSAPVSQPQSIATTTMIITTATSTQIIPALTPTSTTVATTVPSSPRGTVLGASAYNFTQTLKRGSSGEAATELQKILIAGGFLKIAAPTGYFGAQTEIALKAYQSAHSLDAVGYTGPKTRALLNQGATPSMSDGERSILIQKLRAQLQILLAQIASLMASSTVQVH